MSFDLIVTVLFINCNIAERLTYGDIAATINFALSSVRLLIEGGSYSRAATIDLV